MERLTKRSEDTSSTMVWFVDKEKWGMRYEPCEMDSHQIREVLCKLAEYEDAEEDGLLIRLQVRNGDYVYNNGYGFPCSYKIIGYFGGIEEEIVYYYKNSDGSVAGSFPSSEIGKKFFLTFEEAEQALAKMKGE